MLPAALTAKAIQICAAMLAATDPGTASTFPIAIVGGASLVGKPRNIADAEATVRDLLALGADFTAGPLRINGRDFATYGLTPSSVFDACAIAHAAEESDQKIALPSATVSSVTALLRQSFGARITDTMRPINANYGARYSWHKVGQAIDFVPAGGVGAINRAQVLALMAANGIRLIELLGPGDRGHSNHWHIAFARPGQIIDPSRSIEEDEDWILTAATTEKAGVTMVRPEARSASVSTIPSTVSAPPAWDVFAVAQWRARQGGGS